MLGKARLQRARNKITNVLEIRELQYAHTFTNALDRLDVRTPPLYPTAAAANYSLLYLLLRSLTELPVERGLELGMGQSSYLFSALCPEAVSVDHDPSWVASMSAELKHASIHAPLVRRDVHGRVCNAYDFTPEPADLVLVDGPWGTDTAPRWGTLQTLDACLGEEYVVIFDDAERPGEQAVIRRFMATRDAQCHLIQARKAQFVAYTDRFAAVRFF